jgi:hypothetical protein
VDKNVSIILNASSLVKNLAGKAQMFASLWYLASLADSTFQQIAERIP